MASSVLVVLAICVLTGAFPARSRRQSGETFCESECRCEGQRVSCSPSRMAASPAFLPGGTRILDSSHRNNTAISGSCSVNLKWSRGRLNLSNNRISKVVLGTFKGFTSMETFSVNGNKLQYISWSSPRNMHQTVRKSRDQSPRACLPSVTVLLVTNNSLGSIPKGLRSLVSLEILDLSFNEIKQIRGDDFQNCSQMTNVNLRHNKINTLYPGAFRGLTKLQLLNLADNALKTMGPAAIILSHLPELHIELTNNPIDNTFRRCAFQHLIASTSRPFKTTWSASYSESPAVYEPSTAHGDSDLVCEGTPPTGLVVNGVTVLEGNDGIQICALTEFHGSQVSMQWAQPSKNTGNDPRINHDAKGNFVIYKPNYSHKGLFTCMPDVKEITFDYASVQEGLLPGRARNVRDLRRNVVRLRTQEDFTLAVCLSVIISFICAFLLGFFLRPYIEILCNKMKRNKEIVAGETYRNYDLSDESLEDENYQSAASISVRHHVNGNKKSGSVSLSTDDSVLYKNGISTRREEKSLTVRPLQRHRNYNVPQLKGNSSDTVAESESSDFMYMRQTVWQRPHRTSITFSDDQDQELDASAASGSSAVISDLTHVHQISAHSKQGSGESSKQIIEDALNIPKTHTSQSNALSKRICGNEDTKRRIFEEDMDDSCTDEEFSVRSVNKQRQHNLFVGSGYAHNSLPTNRPFQRHADVSRDMQNMYDMHTDEMNQDLKCSTPIAVTANKQCGDKTSVVSENLEIEPQPIGSALNLADEEFEANYESGPMTLQGTELRWRLSKYPQFVLRTESRCVQKDVPAENDYVHRSAEEDVTDTSDCTIQINNSFPKNCEEEHFVATTNGKKLQIDSDSCKNIHYLGVGNESFNFEDSRSDISYDDSGTDEGSSFRFSPSSSFSGSVCSVQKSTCHDANGDSTLSEQNLDKIDGLILSSNQVFHTYTPSPPSSRLMLTAEREAENMLFSDTVSPSESNTNIYMASEQDLESNKLSTLMEVVSGHEGLYPRNTSSDLKIIHSQEAKHPFKRTFLTIPVGPFHEGVKGNEGVRVKAKMEQLRESDYSADLSNQISSNNSEEENKRLATQDTAGILQYQRDSQRASNNVFPDADYNEASQSRENVIFSPRPVDFGSNWARYIYAEPMGQPIEFTVDPSGTTVFDSENDVKAMPESTLQAQIVTISETRVPVEAQDSKQRCGERIHEGISNTELVEKQYGSCKTELKCPNIGDNKCLYEIDTTDFEMEIKPNPARALHGLFSVDEHNNSLVPLPPGEPTEWRISQLTATGEPSEGARAREQPDPPSIVVNFQHIREKANNPQEAVHQHRAHETKSGNYVKKHRVFDGFITSLQSVNKDLPDK